MKLVALTLLALVPLAPITTRGTPKPAQAAPPKVTSLLMFEGQAEEALELYVSLLPGSKIESLERYGPGEPGAEGSVKLATVSLAGSCYLFIDSNVKHPFTFTPSISLFVTCADEAEIDALSAKLSEDGKVFMPLGSYGFSKKFAWVADRFGVSWQLTLPN